MNLRFLETFVWVARLKSFRLTAEKLFSTQASISSRIAALEDELGTRLFLRDSKGVSLTPEGQKVLEYAERMIDTMQALKQSISDTGSIQGRIRIGAMDTVIHTWLSPFVTRVMERYPAVEIELTADTARNLNEQLLKGYLDIVFQTDMVNGDSVRNLQLAVFPVRWIVPTGSLSHRRSASPPGHSQPAARRQRQCAAHQLRQLHRGDDPADSRWLRGRRLAAGAGPR